jgi:ATP-dependent DNA helicase RecQ
MIDGMVAAQKAMSALLRTSGRFLPGHLANLLVGNATDAIRRQGHDQLPTFGIGRERSAAAWRSIFRQIAAADLIERGDEEGRWHVTSAGRAILSGQATLPLIATELVAPTREAPNETGAAQEPALTSDDQRLFAKLKAKRLEIARSRRLPPYTVLTDRSLRAIAQTRPSDEAELAALHGIGPAKIASYGKIILEIVREHQD